MLIKKHYFIFLLLLLSFCIQQGIHAQCTTPINTFPYNEDFEASDGNWVRSSASHWEWGQVISKPVITSAGGGLKCWLVGGFSGSQYNSGNSFLQSPCFDISSLSNPEISFKVFWETERKYDGASLQYSLNGGTNWLTLGSTNSNSNCSGQNWFNYDPINFLSGPGWSGNIQSTSGSCQGTGGSGGWLTARHSLSAVAGSTGIIFRFGFGAGTTCNSFDGFAIDDVEIGEAIPNSADFTYTCGGSNTVGFGSNSVGCKTSVAWDFGDVASGANNISSFDNPTHVFSSPGNYTITLTTNFTSGPSLVVAKSIKVIALTSSVTGVIKCNGDNTGAITVSVNPAGTYNYSWDTSPPQSTPSISGLGAGTYTVSVTGTNTCSASLPVTLNEPAVLSLATTISDAKCGSNNGSISSAVTGGTVPYNYSWSNSQATPSINNLAPGNYSLLLTDANGCTANANNLQVNAVVIPANVFLGKDTTICPGEKLVLNPGSFVSYKWQDNSSAPTYTVTTTGTYSVAVTDNFGCTGSSSIKVTVDCSEIFFPSAFTPNGDGFNDAFGPLPLTALGTLKDYKLAVFGRWGEVIFTSTDPFKKWDGTYKGKPLTTQACTWVATYTQKSFLATTQKGTVNIIR